MNKLSYSVTRDLLTTQTLGGFAVLKLLNIELSDLVSLGISPKMMLREHEGKAIRMAGCYGHIPKGLNNTRGAMWPSATADALLSALNGRLAATAHSTKIPSKLADLLGIPVEKITTGILLSVMLGRVPQADKSDWSEHGQSSFDPLYTTSGTTLVRRDNPSIKRGETPKQGPWMTIQNQLFHMLARMVQADETIALALRGSTTGTITGGFAKLATPPANTELALAESALAEFLATGVNPETGKKVSGVVRSAIERKLISAIRELSSAA